MHAHETENTIGASGNSIIWQGCARGLPLPAGLPQTLGCCMSLCIESDSQRCFIIMCENHTKCYQVSQVTISPISNWQLWTCMFTKKSQQNFCRPNSTQNFSSLVCQTYGFNWDLFWFGCAVHARAIIIPSWTHCAC